MKNTFGQSVAVTVFGESHGSAVGAVIDGLAPGLTVDEERIAAELSRRRPKSEISTARQERDKFSIVSGVFNGKTTGAPICIVIPNEDAHSSDYRQGIARPSHADYAAFCKYHGFEDYRGGGHFSGRVTAAFAAAAGILTPALEKLGITVATHIAQCGGVADRAFGDIEMDAALLKERAFPTLDEAAGEKMRAEILKVKAENDSIGGLTETLISGAPAGLGEPWFDSCESVLSHALFSIGGIKGVEFGGGFALAQSKGSQANDAFYMDGGQVKTKTNRSGGINGGITNGMPIMFRCAVKPTASIAAEQKTVDFINGTDQLISIKGRHDPSIVPRVCPVIDYMSVITLCDLLAQRYGTDVFVKGAL